MHRGDEEISKYENHRSKTELNFTKRHVAIFEEQRVHKEQLQGQGPLPHNRRIPWGGSQHV